jgi:hypothetical protein
LAGGVAPDPFLRSALAVWPKTWDEGGQAGADELADLDG